MITISRVLSKWHRWLRLSRECCENYRITDLSKDSSGWMQCAMVAMVLARVYEFGEGRGRPTSILS